MIVDGEYVFPGPRQTVWDLLQDPDVMVKAMPGARRLTLTGDGTYEGVIRVGVGPVTAAEWVLSVVLSDRQPPESYDMQVDSKGPIGFTRGAATVTLVEAEPGVTVMRYHADLQIGGKVAAVGQRLLDQVARLMTRRGLEALHRELTGRLEERALVLADEADPGPGGSASGDADADASGAGAADSAPAAASDGFTQADPAADALPADDPDRAASA